jgi:DNA integrity scanning protein DisA with diadenylate cyclase activity
LKKLLFTIATLATLSASATDLSKLSLNELNSIAKESVNQMIAGDVYEDVMEKHAAVLEELRKRSHSGLEKSERVAKVMGMNPLNAGYIRALEELNDQ